MQGATGYTGRYMLLESSTIFLNIMWMQKECGVEKSLSYRLFSYCFLTLFTLVRIVYMPYLTGCITLYEPEIWKGVIMTAGEYALYVACILQFYWFKKIIALVLFPSKKEKDAKSKKEK